MYTQKEAEEDKKRFEQMAIEADGRGDHAKAGSYRVEAFNCERRVGMKKAHRPNLGPYSGDNPCCCVHCGKPRDRWVEGEECIPK